MPQQDELGDSELEDFLRDEIPPPAPATIAPPPELSDEELADVVGDIVVAEEAPKRPSVPVSAPMTDSDLDDALGDMVVHTKDRGLSKPWMKFHEFRLVKTVDEVRDIVDRALAHGRCGLDLETEGLDNRIIYKDDKPETVHKIVGYCISVRGVGHYIPVRHYFNPIHGETDPNVPNEGVEAEIRRLCLASQPVLTEEGFKENCFGSTKIAVPSKVIIYFWHSKFDQEFLYPVTGIDVWHPDSFQDGMLAAYSVYSDDPNLGLKEKARQLLSINDPDQGGKTVAYEMIKFEELFPPRTASKDRRFHDLYPEDGSAEVLYACSDAICTELLCETQRVEWLHTREGLTYEYKNVVAEALLHKYLFTYRLEKQAVQAVRDMERRRAKIDKPIILSILAEAEAELAKYEGLIRTLAERHGLKDFNPGSSQQLSEFLFEKDGLDITPKPDRNEASGFYKTDAATLEHMAELHESAPVLGWIVKYRQVEKIIGTYLKSMSENCNSEDELRFNFKQTGATTGRFTAPAGEPAHGYSGIPIQGIPARDDPKKPKVAQALRKIFVARDGYTLVKVDYAGQELRIVANLSNEPKWVNEFLSARAEGREADLHTLTAQAFFGSHITKNNKTERNMAKIANFSLIYGGGTAAIMRATKCDKVEAARRKSNFDKSVPTFAGWVSGQHAFVKKNKGVYTAFRRFIAIPDANLKEGDIDSRGTPVSSQDARKIQAACERKSTNFPIQGSGADILKISLIRLLREFHQRGWRREGGDDSVRMIMTIHDEIVFEVKHERLMEALPVIIAAMESPSKMAKWKIPLVVEPLIGKTWDAKHDWHKIMKGEEPVPDWLQGIVIPGEHHEEPPAAEAHAEAPETTQAPAPAAQPAPQVAPKPRTPSAPPPATANGNGHAKGLLNVATFVLGATHLTNRSVDLVFEAVAASLDPDRGTFLRLMCNDGEVLINPTRNPIPVLPDRLKAKFQDKNLGSGDFVLKEEPL